VYEKLNNAKYTYVALQKFLKYFYIKKKSFLEKEERMDHRLIPRKTMKHLPRGVVLAGGRPKFHHSNQPLSKAEGMVFFAQPLTLNLW
jgi:hypothetical protein